jgi:uncharacterized radical SAM superfamily protein
MTLKKALMLLALAGAGLGGAQAAGVDEECPDAHVVENDYPTATRADYIFGCMQVNGQTRIELDKCACSMDVLASILPHKEYEEAETILSVRQRGGESVAYMFTPAMEEKVKNLKRAQIEGELRCF